MKVQHDQQLPPWKQLLYLFVVSIGCAIIGTVITIAIIALFFGQTMAWQVLQMNNTGTPEFISAFRIFLALGNTLFVFFVPAVIFGYFVVREPDEYLCTRNYFPPVLLLLSLAFMFFFLPAIDITGYFNQQLHFPPALHGLDQWIRDSEKQAQGIIKIVLDMKTPADLAVSVLIVGFLPALSEEFFFRGCMQTIFQRWIKNTHWAIWTTAFIFSFLHFEFLGFVPRFLLGGALGYLFNWSRSIWPSVIAHFLNNALAVVGYYMWQHHLTTTNPDSNAPMFSQAWIYLLSTVIALLILAIYRRVTLAYTPLITEEHIVDGEELD